ncbi:putative ribonuclease H-like domain-containing protein [Tanacetum coccineum]
MEFESANSNTTAIDKDTSSKARLAIDGVGFDWSDMAEEKVHTNMALMAFLDSEVYNDKTCSKTCLKNYETLKKHCDDFIVKLNQIEFTAATYKRGLAIVEEQLITYRKNEVLFSEEVTVLKREVACKDYEINVLKSVFEKVKQEKEGIEFKIEKFDKASKDLDKLLGSQITDKSKKGLGYSVVPLPHPLIYNRPKKLDMSYSGFDEFKEPEFKGYGPENSKQESDIVCDKKSDDSKENSDNSLVKEQVSKDTSSFVKSSLNVNKETVFLLIKRPTKPDSASITLKKHNYIDARGRSKHMTGTIAYLSDFKEFDGCYVAFGGGAYGGRITGKGTLKTDSLDFDVYFVNELKFNLFSISQMCDKKNYVLFINTECLVLSPNFKLSDENQILLKIPRKDNMYSFDMKNIVPKESLTYLIANATLDESMLCIGGLGSNTELLVEVVSTACYVQNRVLVVKPHNKTPYELFRGFKPALIFMRPFGCPVTILNTLDSLGKFDGKSDECFFVGYSLSSKAFRVYNTRTRRVEENLHIGFLENKPMIEGNGPKWLFDIDSLTQSMNYVPITAGTISNDSVGTSEEINQDCIVMPIWKDTSYFDSPTKDDENGEPKTADDAQKQVEDSANNENAEQDKFEDDSSSKDLNAVRQHVNTASPDVNTCSLKLNAVGPSVNTSSSNEQDSPKDMFTMGASHTLKGTHIEFFSDEDEPEVDLGNILNSYIVPTTPNTRIHKDHPIDNVISDVKSTVQTRRMTKPTSEQGFLSDVYEQKTHDTLNTCLYACFLSQIEPTSIAKALSDSSWVEAINRKDERVIVIRNKARLVAQGFKDPDHPDKVYKVVKALYGVALSTKSMVGDEAVHKELGDRIERADTTASSLEAEQDSGSGPRCQDTILGDVDAQTRFEITSKLVHDSHLSQEIQALIDNKKLIITKSSIQSDLHLGDAGGTDCLLTATIFEELEHMGLSAKTTAWNEFSSAMASAIICLATNQKFNFSKYIFDAMLGDMSHHKKIYVNPSHTKKIFANMKREGNDFSRRVTPLFATMMVQPNQEEGVDSGIPTDSHQTPITTQPSTSRSQKQSRRKQRKDTAVTQEEPQQDDSVPTPSNNPLISGEDSMQLSELMILCTNLQKQVLDLEKAKDAQAKEIVDLKKRVQKLERKKKSRTIGLKRLRKVGMSRRVESSKDKDSLGDHEDAFKQGRSIEDIDKDADVSLVDDT